MAGVTPIAGLPYPELGDDPNIELVSKPLAQELDDQIVPRFATTTARDTAITAPTAGQVCHVATNGLMVYTGTAWIPQAGIEIARLIMQADTASTNSTPFPVPFAAGSQDYLPFGGHNTVTNNTRLVLPFPGRYLAYGVVAWFSTANGARETSIYKNGTAIVGSTTRNLPGQALQVAHNSQATFSANGTTDYIQLVGTQSSGGALNVMGISVTAWATHLSVIYLGRAW